MALAHPGETLVSASVPLAAIGTDHRFELFGEHTLKGVTGMWTLYRTNLAATVETGEDDATRSQRFAL
jgi:class 3 adenylate cyclase